MESLKQILQDNLFLPPTQAGLQQDVIPVECCFHCQGIARELQAWHLSSAQTGGGRSRAEDAVEMACS